MKFWAKNIFAIFLGLGSCAGTGYWAKSSFHKLISWEHVRGELSSRNDSRRTVSFKYNDNTYTVHANVNKKEFGSTPVIFPKEDPAQAEVLDYSTLLILPLIVAAFGAALIAAGYFSIRHKLSGRPTPDPANHVSHPQVQAVKEFLEKRER